MEEQGQEVTLTQWSPSFYNFDSVSCSFQTASLTLQASHPSTPPIPLSRKITIGGGASSRAAAAAAAAPALKSGSEGSLNSENEENESPAEVNFVRLGQICFSALATS